MKYVITITFFIFSLSSLYSCTNNIKQRDNFTSTQNQSSLIDIKRFDKDLFQYVIEPDSSLNDSLVLLYGNFLEAFGSNTINNVDFNNPIYFTRLVQYFSNPTLNQIYKDALIKFENVELYEEELDSANRLIQTYFSGKKLPQLAMHVSGFKANTLVLENLISISIDKYLGSDYVGYVDFFDDYQRQQMKPKMITHDYLKAWIITELPLSNKRKNLLSEIINEGKTLYVLELLLPNWNEADLIGYTPSELDWAKENETEIWKTTINNNYLFSTDYLTILKYIDDAPYTSTISKKSPGRLGAWIGWQIVKSYAEKTNSNLEEVIAELDVQNILKQSKYNP